MSKVLKAVSSNKGQVELNGKSIKEVDKFCYLGSMLDRNQVKNGKGTGSIYFTMQDLEDQGNLTKNQTKTV